LLKFLNQINYKQKYENKQATSHVRCLAHDSNFKHEKCWNHVTWLKSLTTKWIWWKQWLKVHLNFKLSLVCLFQLPSSSKNVTPKSFSFCYQRSSKELINSQIQRRRNQKCQLQKSSYKGLRLRGGITPLWPFNILELKTFILAKLRTILLQVYKEQCKKYDTLSMFHRHCSHHRTLVVMFWNIFSSLVTFLKISFKTCVTNYYGHK